MPSVALTIRRTSALVVPLGAIRYKLMRSPQTPETLRSVRRQETQRNLGGTAFGFVIAAYLNATRLTTLARAQTLYDLWV